MNPGFSELLRLAVADLVQYAQKRFDYAQKVDLEILSRLRVILGALEDRK